MHGARRCDGRSSWWRRRNQSFVDDGLWGFEIADADGYVIGFFRLHDGDASGVQTQERRT